MIPVMRTIVRSRWFTSGFVVLALIAAVWIFGPLLGIGALHPLETDIARYITIAALVAGWLIWNLLRIVRANRRDRALADSIKDSPADLQAKEVEKASAEEIARLKDRLDQALKALRKSPLGSSRKRLAAMPWYVIIGPPGAGKTTALQNCGLKFPLETASQPLRGVGGTRNCEWLFSDEAVLIDTAGRYTTQNSQEAVDSAAWLGFLQLLKKHRSAQPLNGVLVAISLADIATLTDAERASHARTIRSRLRELHDTLRLRLPVYVLFTKADLIAGFNEFFDNLGKEEREQVWGLTLPLDEGTDDEGAVAQFAKEFDLLVERLNDRVLERVHQEPDIRRRRLIYGFPQQVASLRTVADEFLTEIFRPSRLEARPLLRGVYFTSGTQEGTPIDRLLGAMAGEFGLPRQAVAARVGAGRSYFLSRLLREVVFGEAGLAGLDRKVERRARFISIGTYAGCGLVLLALLVSWINSYIGNRALIAEVHAAQGTYRAQVAELQRRGPTDQDLAATLPSLDTLRRIRGGYTELDDDPPVSLTFGLYQGSKLGRAASDAYINALNRILLPRLLSRVEARLAASMNNVDFLYQTLKVYLIMGREGPLDRELVGQWLDADLLAAYPTEDEAPTRNALLDHADALLRQPLQQIPLNAPLIAQAREVLNREPLAEYSYNRLLRSKRVTELAEWTVADNGGPGAGRVFEYRSKKKLDSGVPGIYTWSGYHNVILPLLPTVTQDIAEDAWVLGRTQRNVRDTIRDTSRLRRDVLGLYLDDYTRRWDAMLADIALKPFANLRQSVDQLALLSGPASPLRDLMLAIDAQTQLSRPAATDAAVAAAQERGARVAARAARFGALEARTGLSIRQNEIVSIFTEAFGTDAGGKPIDPAKRVDDHFKAFHDWVAGAEGKPAGLETAIRQLLTLYQGLNQAAIAPNPGQSAIDAVQGANPAAGGSSVAQWQQLTRAMPPEAAALLGPVVSNATQAAVVVAGQEMSEVWRGQVLPLCEAAFGRYPFVGNSPNDVPMDDFIQLLGPGGKIEGFFNQFIKPFVNTSQRPWKVISADRAPPALSQASLAEFEKAAQIREGLFANGPTIQLRFQLTPVSLDPAVAQISIEIGGQTLTYAHGPTEGQAFGWPGSGGKTLTRVTLTPTASGSASVTEVDGAWALLRLLDGRIAPSPQPDKFRVTFNGAGGSAVFELTASSVRNPFTLAALRSFRCPATL